MQACIETSLEYNEPTVDIGIARSTVQDSIGEPVVPAAAAPTVGNGLQAENTLTETEIVGVVQSPNGELALTGADAAETQAAQQTEETEKAPERYRPPMQKAPQQIQAGGRPANQEVKRAAPSEVLLGIRVRLTFDRFGFCKIGLLPERTSGLDNEVATKLGGKPFLLVAQEDWYEDLHPENLGSCLREGAELKAVLADERRMRWLLTGRDLYVLASNARASGFVSTNRLGLGRSHVVLCTAELLEKTETILNDAGCKGYTRLSEEEGIPAGWTGLRGVKPTKALPLEPGSDPFYAIKPAPDIEIDLDGGIRLGGFVWLAGYPPKIKVLGESAVTVRALIDGKEARRSVEGLLTSEGYDLPGNHSVYCEGLSCSHSYSMEEAPDAWERWPAYRFRKGDICGPVVELAPEPRGGGAVSVPMSNPVLLGANPGEIFYCSRRGVARWKGFVPFDVVWALPAQPLRSDKKSANILQFSSAPVVPVKVQTKAAVEWSVAILDASRKGLKIANGTPESAVSWRDYKKTARSIWRAAR